MSQPYQDLPLPIIAALVISGVGFVLVRFIRNVQAKRSIWPFVVLGLWVMLMYTPLQDPKFGWRFAAIMAIPFAALYFRYHFCPACGSMIQRGFLFQKAHFCPKCGVNLEDV